MTTYTIQLEEDPESGDLMLPLTESMLAEAGWSVGDTVEWVDNNDGTWKIQKVKNENQSK